MRVGNFEYKEEETSEEYDNILDSPPADDCNILAIKAYGEAFNYRNTDLVRYTNILPLKNSRVQLNLEYANDEFFEGNYINVGSIGKVISASAPLTESFENWYGMLWSKNCSKIFCLTNIIEKGNVKMDPYWPTFGFPEWR